MGDPPLTEGIPADLDGELRQLLAALSQDLGIAALHAVPAPGSLRATIQGSILLIPTAHVDHWRRFHVLPHALVRDAAYQAKRLQLSHAMAAKSSVEADAMAYAERFLRAVMDPET